MVRTLPRSPERWQPKCLAGIGCATSSRDMARPLAFVLGMALSVAPALGYAGGTNETRFDVRQFRVVERESGKTDYYKVVADPTRPFIRAEYPPGADTAVLGVQLPDGLRRTARGLHWMWRAGTLPHDMGRCDQTSGIADSAALVYVVWKRGLRWYTLRYVWATVAPKGAVCNSKRNLFLAEDTVVLESGAGTGGWVGEELDLASEFRRHFAGGDAQADVPDFVGLAIMTDGDQTRSVSSADYADFVVHSVASSFDSARAE
jgi:hypothetical protein